MPFQPSDLANLFVWLRADVGAFQDAAKAVPCTNNTPVYTWENYGSDPSDFVQSSGGVQPVYFSSGGVGGQPIITFTSDYLVSTTASIGTGTPVTGFVMLHPSSISGTGIAFGTNGGANFQMARSSALAYYYRGGGGGEIVGNWQTARPSIMSCIAYTTSYGWFDNGPLGTPVPNGTNCGNNAISNLYVGRDSAGSYPFDGNYYEIILYDAQLSTTDIQQVRDYLFTRIGAALWPTATTPGSPANIHDSPVNYPITGIYCGDSVDSSFQQYGIRQETVDVEGSPYRLALDTPGRWRFRWGVEAGSRSIECRVKQASNITGQRPTLVVLKNPTIGVNADVTVTAGSGAGWLDMPTASVTPSSNGVLWVELRNNDVTTFPVSPALFGQFEVA